MKKKLFSALLLFVCGAAAADVPKYVDKLYAFSLSGLKGWEMRTEEGQKEKGPRVIFVSPPGENKTDFRASVNVVVEILPAIVPLDDYFKKVQEVYKKSFPQYVAETQGQTTIAKSPFKYLVFSHKMGGRDTKVLQYATIRGAKAIVLTCSAAAAEFKKQRASFRKIVGSLEWGH